MVEMAMGTMRSILNSNADIVRQLPPQITGLYGKSRAGFPLGFGHASSYVGRGVVLVGYGKCLYINCSVQNNTINISIVFNILIILI